MFDFLFSKRVTIPVTIIVLTAMLISFLYQTFFVDTPQKRRYTAIENSNIVKYGDFVSDTICDIEVKIFQKYLFCNYKKGCYFGESAQEIESEISAFIQKGETVLKKKKNDSTAYFINNQDTLTVVYELYPSNSVLCKGKIKR